MFTAAQKILLSGSIARRLILYLVLFSSVITLIATAIQLYWDFQSDFHEVKNDFVQIEQAHLQSIVNDVWVSDYEQIAVELNGLLRLPDMEYLELRSDGRIIAAAGQRTSQRIHEKQFPLFQKYRGKQVNIGTLTAAASIDNIYSRLWNKLLLILVSNALKTFLVSAFVFWVFHHLVVRRLADISEYLEKIDLNSTTSKIALPVQPGRNVDELDVVSNAINKMQSSLAETHASLLLNSQAIESTTNGILITDPRQNDNPIVFANKAIEEMTGYSRNELIGRNPRCLQAGHHDQKELEQIRQAILDNKSVKVRLRNYRKDMTAYVNELSVSPMWDEAGDITHFVGIQSDVTEQASTEDALKERENRLSSIFETAPDAIITTDVDGHITSFSKQTETIFDCTADEIIGSNISALIPVEHANHSEYMRQYRDGGREVTGRRKDGSTFPAYLAVNETEIDGEKTITIILHDMTKEKAQEELLQQAQKMEAIGQLTGGIAHDFNNLLLVIIGNLELIDKSALNDSDHISAITEAHEAAELAAELTGRLLSFGRRQPLNQEPLIVNDLLLQMRDLLVRSLGETIQIDMQLAPNLHNVKADAGQLQNAILNISINARDAMPSGGQLYFKTSQVIFNMSDTQNIEELEPGEFLCICVSDTGEGMPKDVLERVLEPFYTTKEVGKGSGLGLSMTYGFIKQSRGHMEVSSEPGVGTEISLYLPISSELATVDTKKPDNSTSQRTAEQKHAVLIVEDDPLVRRLTERRVSSLGYRVLVAETAAEALSIVEGSEQVDLVFTDIVMPGGISGIDLRDQLREKYPNCGVLLTSGYSSQSSDNAHLQKPYELSELARVIHDALGRKL